mmetsp:Transcript_35842/g.99341  ORF Transcript_35842/g.99341 Transcript_35842/m.99341 type:complete len:216 (-) Transcript_35842:1224-1871(-)
MPLMHSAALVRSCCLNTLWRSHTSSCLWKKTLPSARFAVTWSPERRTRMATVQVSSKPQLSTTRCRFRSRTSSSTNTRTTVAWSGGVVANSGEPSGTTAPPSTRTPNARHSRARRVSSQAAACCCWTCFRPSALRTLSGVLLVSSLGAFRLANSTCLPLGTPLPPPLPRPEGASKLRATMGMVPFLQGRTESSLTFSGCSAWVFCSSACSFWAAP